MKPSITSVSLEKDLRDYLAQNPSLIESGLSLVGKEYPISGAGKSDLLCQDKRGNYVIIETKRDRESDKVVGQILRYIGGLRKEGKRVRGIIIVNEPDEKLDFAIEAVKDLIKLKYYRVSFEITDSYER
jgi:RecB family endonuclease NucS